MATRRFYFFGRPLSRRDKKARLEAIEHAKIEYLSVLQPDLDEKQRGHMAKHLTLEVEEQTIDRITDKSIGLMQVLALLLAGMAIKHPENPYFSGAEFTSVGVAVLLLLGNMRLISNMDPENWAVEKDLELASDIASWRGLRLMLSLALTAIAVSVWLWVVITEPFFASHGASVHRSSPGNGSVTMPRAHKTT